MLSSILQPAWLELETDQNIYKITLVWYIRWDTGADLEVFRTRIRNYLLSMYLIKRLNEWKDFVENRGMRVNMNKTKVMISEEWQKVT